MATDQGAARPGCARDFTACVADYRQTVDELREIERRMSRSIDVMRTDGAPRERVLVARKMLADVRRILRRVP
jgi:hypothetical protein